jgi:hypothetical protein
LSTKLIIVYRALDEHELFVSLYAAPNSTFSRALHCSVINYTDNVVRPQTFPLSIEHKRNLPKDKRICEVVEGYN